MKVSRYLSMHAEMGMPTGKEFSTGCYTNYSSIPPDVASVFRQALSRPKQGSKIWTVTITQETGQGEAEGARC